MCVSVDRIDGGMIGRGQISHFPCQGCSLAVYVINQPPQHAGTVWLDVSRTGCGGLGSYLETRCEVVRAVGTGGQVL